MIKFEPLGDRVLVKPIQKEEIRASGLIIPDAAKEKPQEGEIVACGPGRTENGFEVPMRIFVGDRILYGKYTGTEIKLEDETYLIMHQADIIGRLKP